MIRCASPARRFNSSAVGYLPFKGARSADAMSGMSGVVWDDMVSLIVFRT